MTDRLFQIGLVMAGAISGGAYQAGVIDFLLEALECWTEAKRSNRPDLLIPRHRVEIASASGASAGAMTTAILARCLGTRIQPVRDPIAYHNAVTAAVDPFQESASFVNPLYEAWVRSIDIRHLLGKRDLGSGARVTSVLDSTVLQQIADNVVRTDGAIQRATKPDYVPDALPIYLTTTNLRGVPYSLDMAGGRHGRYMMLNHADYSAFALTWTGTKPTTPDGGDFAILEANLVGQTPEWEQLIAAALASGAFPVGLAPKLLKRDAGQYSTRKWRVPNAAKGDFDWQSIMPAWPGMSAPTNFPYWNVDGGVCNNEPLELVRGALAGGGRNAREGHKSDRAVVMIDPFPDDQEFQVQKYPQDTDLVQVISSLFGALINQARFKADELILASDRSCFSRFMISPSARASDGAPLAPAMTASVLSGFGGFLSQRMREHDFLLGRRNCQAFLMRHFVLPERNPLFESLRQSEEALERSAAKDRNGKAIRADPSAIDGFWSAAGESAFDDFKNDRFIPIIPLFGSAAEPVAAPQRPQSRDVDLDAIQNLIRDRINEVVPALIGTIRNRRAELLSRVGWWLTRPLGIRANLVETVVEKISAELKALDNSARR